uniref:uncharacterized protein LOC113474137 n=1 Tax=Ciona intestinalis TaxID=7719 RepID=UPI000EF46258|nr:uncharacterized protein LOC113474137 [Ciona intestinalis]|eukprot:XP_026689725.1 uncharacterized protein LOC113474137 [Ciona intestinalis]
MEAVLFYHIAAEFYGNQSKAGLIGIKNCANGIKESIEAMLSRNKELKSIIRTHVIPLMHDMREMIRRSVDVNEKDRCLWEVWCLHRIERSEGLVDNFSGCEKTIKEAIAIMERVFQQGAATYLVYGHFLNNLGYTYEQTSRPNDACEYFRKAIAAYGKAEDIDDDLRAKWVSNSIQFLKDANRQIQ